jgi:thiomorpholine-carboxylate dehydrogenase
VSAVATRLLSPPNASRLAILGSGVQARAHVRALGLVRKFEEIRIWSRNSQHAKLLADEIGGIATSAEEAVRDADVVVTVTNSPEPVLRGKWLKPGVLVNAVESGDALLAGANIYAELGELLAGVKPKPETEITVFKSLGLAVEDLAAAKLVLDALQKS